ncbi:hypothetical protein C8J57DRAFT_1719445 [Mycena rebaudengoi]|nr:hypothetical protein C8J57DRAFT_1719445 [Mycena rebaudengoi]
MVRLAKSASLRTSLTRTRYKLYGLKVLWALLALYMQAAAFVGFLGPRARLYRDCAAAGPAAHSLLHATHRLRHLLPPRIARRLLPTPSPPLPSAPHRPTHARRADMGILRLPCYQPERVALTAPEEACEHWLERAAVSVSAGMIEAALFLVVSTHYAHMLRSAPASALDPPPTSSARSPRAPPCPYPRASVSSPSRTPLPRRCPVRPRARQCFVCVDPLGEGPGRGDSALQGHGGWQCEVWISATWPSGMSTPRVREAFEGRVGRERRERKADAGVVGVKREWLWGVPRALRI